jgi:UDP-glucuronate 4-epimerase
LTTLITGGTGFIGSHLAHHLLKRGDDVLLLDNFDDYYDPALKRARRAALAPDAPLVEVDIRDNDGVAEVFAAHNIHRVVNLAAMPGVRYSADRARLYLDVNTTGAVNLMDMAAKYDVEVFVQASTSSVYGQAERVPFREEDAADRPLAPYPASKRASELFGHSYHNLHGLNVTVLRFFNVYGPHGRPDMMPVRALRAILDGEPIHMWNAGQIKRDWTYVDDTVAGIIAALDRPLGFQTINLGCGDPLPFADFISIYEDLLGKQAVKIIEDAPPTEPLITYCDNTRARELLGFNPKTHIADGLANVWDWYREANKV